MEKPTTALLLLTSWDLDNDGKTGQPTRFIVRDIKEHTLQSEQISELFCTILDVEVSEDKKQDARSVGVTLIPASRPEWSNPEEDPPSLNWIIYHDQYYPKLKDLPKIAHVVGCHKKTMTAATKIHKNLFPGAKLHEITISKLPSAALFVFKTWETAEQSLTTKPTYMIIKEFCEKTQGLNDKSDIFCTFLDIEVSEDKLKDAKKAGVTLIPAIRNKRLEPHEDPPAIPWLANHEIYYPQLKNLKQIKHVIGCDPDTKNAATAIYESLFPKSEFHLLDFPKPPPGALFIGDGWDENDCGLTGFHRTIIQDFCARKGKAVKAYATVADVKVSKKQKEDAEKCGVTLIPATRKEKVDPEEDKPKLEWLLNHEIYFQVLKRLENITHVIGYAPKTGRAAADIREKIFSNAELVLINHAYEDNDCLWEADRVKFREKMLKLAGEADVIFSIGPSMYEYFKNQYRASINGKNLADIPHAEIFPKPRAAFFERDPYLPDDGVGTHCILTYGQINTLEALESCDNLAASIGTVANRRKEMYAKPLEWSLMGIPPLNQTEVTTILRDSTQSGHIRPKLFDHYSAKTLLTSLHQSHLCLPAPCYKDYGFCGLEAIATGIPTNAFEDSQLGCLITKYFPMHKDYCVVGRYPTALLAEQMVKTMSNVELAFKSAKKLKEDFKESPGIDKCCSTFASMLTFKRTSTGSGQSDGHGDAIKPADPYHDTTIQVQVKLDETLNQQHLQKERKNGTDDARRQTVDTAWRKCTDIFEGQVREIASSEVTANRVQKTCNDKFGDGVEVTGMATKSLEISVAIPRLVNLYKMEASCESESFTEALEPIMITDEMRELAASAGLPLKLIATYDQTKFDKIELFFLNRDGGGIQRAQIFDGVIEEEFIEEMNAESQSLPLSEAVKGNLTDTEHIVTILQGGQTIEISELKIQKQIIENDLEEVKHEKSILEEQYADLALRLESAEKVTYTQLKDVQSLKQKLTEVDPKKVHDLKSALRQKEKMIVELQTKLSNYEAKLSSLEMQLQQKSADEHQREDEQLTTAAENTSKPTRQGEMPFKDQKDQTKHAMQTKPPKHEMMRADTEKGKRKVTQQTKEGSSFEFHVVEVKSGQATVYGPGLTHGVVCEPCNFTINTKDAGGGGLALAVEGPSKAEIKCIDNKDGTCSASYYPTKPGDYSVIVKFADKHVPGSPFNAKITGGWSKFILDGQGPSPGQKFNYPCGLTFHDDKLLVCDKGNNIVQILNQDYTCEKVLGSFSGQFAKPFKPQSVAVSKDNLYFILDYGNLQIVVCDQNNKVIAIITLPADINPLCIDLLKGFVLVTDVKGHRLLKYTKTGQYVSEVGSLSAGQTQFRYPYFVAVNSKDVIMVSDRDNHCIKCFDSDFNYLYQYGEYGIADSQLYDPSSIAVDGADNVYVCDHINARISMWSRDGTWIGNLFQDEVSLPMYIAVSRDRICVRGVNDKHITVFSK